MWRLGPPALAGWLLFATRASTRLCAGGPLRALGRAQQASGPAGQSAETKTKFSRKAVGNAADEVSA